MKKVINTKQAQLRIWDFDKMTPKKIDFMVKWLRAQATLLKKYKKGDLSNPFNVTLYK